jgi:hypothetical protein
MSPLPAIPPVDGLNHLTLADGTHDVAFSHMPAMRQQLELKTTLMHFDGRAWPLAYFQERSDETWSVDFIVDRADAAGPGGGDVWANLRGLIDGADKQKVLVWTDQFGSQINCVITVDPVSRDMLLGGGVVAGFPGRYQKVSFQIHRVE